jgi:hypothetical protein
MHGPRVFRAVALDTQRILQAIAISSKPCGVYSLCCCLKNPAVFTASAAPNGLHDARDAGEEAAQQLGRGCTHTRVQGNAREDHANACGWYASTAQSAREGGRAAARAIAPVQHHHPWIGSLACWAVLAWEHAARRCRTRVCTRSHRASYYGSGHPFPNTMIAFEGMNF